MTGVLPHTAMVLAAGLGSRLGDGPPKPLRRVGGRALIDRALDMLGEAGVARVVVNTHHRAEEIEAHLAGRAQPDILISRERERLETGGGVAHALSLLGGEPFFVLNSDLVWGPDGADWLGRLAAGFDSRRMDALLLLYPAARAIHYEGPGDFHLASDGRLGRRRDPETAPFLFTGAQILVPGLFDDPPPGAWRLTHAYDRAEAQGRLFGLVCEGAWLDAGTPERLAHAEAMLAGS